MASYHMGWWLAAFQLSIRDVSFCGQWASNTYSDVVRLLRGYTAEV